MKPMVDKEPFPALVRRSFPLLVAATIVTILFTSAVPPNLLVVSGRPAEAVMASYAMLLVAMASDRFDNVTLHKVGSVLAVFTFGGRGGGFIELSIARQTFELLGAVAERILLTCALVLWHASVGSRIAVEREYKKWVNG